MQSNQPQKPHQPPGWGKLGRDALIYVVVALALWGMIGVMDGGKMAIAGGIAYNAILKAWKIIIAVFIVIGLIQVWIPPDKLSKVLGKEAGWKGLALASTIPMLIGGSPLTIFPLLKTLREKGASIAAVMAFIAAWSGKAPLLPLEIKFLGWHFAILRLVLIIPFAVTLGLTSEWILERIGEE
ncbi:hypothetical protein U27_03640 [Candidatus Vecturithrix granuli]|uniref:Permease n=1 Tax=Vecturithrix granuli TaxID=1499967 RepID=A0A081BWH2_VECG1|nr:hypothetical protein U27_03640 [Candidatus Vecturithrix granuli]